MNAETGRHAARAVSRWWPAATAATPLEAAIMRAAERFFDESDVNRAVQEFSDRMITAVCPLEPADTGLVLDLLVSATRSPTAAAWAVLACFDNFSDPLRIVALRAFLHAVLIGSKPVAHTVPAPG